MSLTGSHATRVDFLPLCLQIYVGEECKPKPSRGQPLPAGGQERMLTTNGNGIAYLSIEVSAEASGSRYTFMANMVGGWFVARECITIS